MSTRSNEAILAGFIWFVATMLVSVALNSDGCPRAVSAWIAIGLVTGPLIVFAAVFDWDWAYENGIVRRVVDNFGRFAARLLLLFLGGFATVAGVVFLRGEGYLRDLW